MTAVLTTGLTTVALRVTARQPLAVGRAPQTGQLRDAHSAVPGSVVRGAFAARWIRRNGRPDRADQARQAQFVELFESGALRFGPLIPDGHAPEWLSHLVHKYGRPAGCATPEPDLADTPGTTPQTTCPGCGEALEPTKGGLARISAATDEPLHVDRVHTQIDADDRPVQGKLFTRRSIRRGTRLTGLLLGPGGAVETLLDDPAPLLIGGNRTASGRVVTERAPADPVTPPQVVGKRLVLRLYTPAIFVDGVGRPCRQPDTHQLSELLDVAVTGVAGAWVRTESVGGWHAASGLPKPTERAVLAGSVYVVDCADAPAPPGLARLAAEGVGLRRHEGFGWVAYPGGGDPT